ncbi:quinone-dependent dihydroorotate dehydrogenase [Brevibacterium moorei]|uniref:quinone-dependent dihydroorotate dehydrogenase n=1 Tax=Brevibacterium moorei TaxID=2968457 RepID=UPI00211C741F|nr:quinone-dependent dihydroorotate dehydrogenase [Brevibacterium sp. 68QC2CO]MCQ9384343.1 quinone-dependent dihydroorotate dehydrogenase [Brevibacterium sp. 68QC2CO]
MLKRVYRLIYNAVLRHIDAERIHHLSFSALKAIDAAPCGGRLMDLAFGNRAHPGSRATVMGLDFPNRVGLAAGFDKEATGVRAISRMGFGHVEVGTITAEGQPGNPRPRLFRLLSKHAILNRMGFNNAGAVAVAGWLREQRELLAELPQGKRPVIGVNIGKTKVVPAAEAVADYRASTRVLAPLADYLVINVSSPNTPGLRDLQAVESLRPIITAVQEEAEAVVRSPRSTLGHVPLVVKIAPDLGDEDVEDVARMCVAAGVDGIICTNTTIDRDVVDGADREFAQSQAGGISGPPVAERSFEVLRLVRRTVGSALTIISVGGVTSPADARARLGAGADLVQGYTGLIYEGPWWPGRLVRGLARSRV